MSEITLRPRPGPEARPEISEGVSEGAPLGASAAELRALLGVHGAPLFVLSEAMLRRRYREMGAAFAEAGLGVDIAYSYKTNYLPALCAILHGEGAFAEVVSGVEYRLARALGCAPARIVFNGPHKGREDLALALGEGALVNIDGTDELDIVAALARQAVRPAGVAFRIGLRVSPGAGAGPWARYGLRREGGDVAAALALIARHPGLRLEMLHVHAGTDRRAPAAYAEAARMLAELGDHARGLGLSPETLNLGGGFPAQGSLAPFAAAIREGLGARAVEEGAGKDPPLRLMIEPGRALVDTAMRLLCTVVAVKEVPGVGPAVIVDAGINVLPAACRRDPRPVTVLAPAEGAPAEVAGAAGQAVTVYGPLCMPEDVIARGVLLPPLGVGSVLMIGEVGAYCLTQSMQFMQPRPPVVLLGGEGAQLVRRRETWRDIFALDEIPDRLRPKGCTL